MAEIAMKKLDGQLKCAICLDTYTDPKLLQCFHIYCTKCLARLVVRDQQGLTCPSCCQVTPIPPNGVTGLQSAFRIDALLEIRNDLRATPLRTHYCSEHVDKEVELYCETCNDLICYKCVIRGSKHHSHDYDQRGSPEPSSCHATGKGLEVAVLAEKSTVVLQAIDFNGQPFVKPIKWLQYKLVSEITRATVSGSLERRGQSQYEMIYQPTIKGRHQLHIKVDDQHIRGSPFTVSVKSPVEKLGTPILTIGGVEKPWRVTFNQRGEVVVTELNGDCVSVFSPSGEKLLSFGTHGSGQGQFKSPFGVAVDGDGNILVADNGNHRIQQFTAEGQFITSVGIEGNGPLQFCYPCGITYNTSNNKMYMADSLNHRVQVLNSDLTFSSSFGKPGSGKEQFDAPLDISCDSTGKVYVTDFNNHRIQVFTTEGKFLRMFGRHGDGRGELDHPISITIDTSDRVYVGDWNHRISVFTSDGQFLTSFGREENGPGEFNYPRGLAVDASGVLYVCDCDNNRIQVF